MVASCLAMGQDGGLHRTDFDGVAQMAKEISRRSRAAPVQDVDQDMDQGVDPAALLAELLAHQAGPAQVITGPEWSTQFRPPSIPGTINDKYVKAMLPLRALGWFINWVTWDWKYGAFVGTVLLLIAILIHTR